MVKILQSLEEARRKHGRKMVLQSQIPPRERTAPWLGRAKGEAQGLCLVVRHRLMGECSLCRCAFRSLMRESHKFKVSRLREKLQSNPGS